MKYISKLLFAVLGLAAIFSACDKVGNLPYYSNGVVPTLSSSVTSVAPAPADSLNDVITFSWSYPKYATDSSTVKYILQIDTAGGNYMTAYSRTVSGALSTTFTAKEINNILLGYGLSFGVGYEMEVRLTASYANNNDQLLSNVLEIQMTPYKIPPKVELPASGHLYLVGSATQGGWNNPVPVPSQEFAQVNETTYGGVFDLIGGNEYLVLPLNGDWGHKYSVADNTLPGLNQGGDFGYDLSQNFPGPATSGKYLIMIEFQTGKFSVTPYTSNTLPDNLFIVGDATGGGWNNPVPVPSQQFTRLNSAIWEITLDLNGGKQYLMLPVNGDWGNKYAVADNSLPDLAAGGSFGYNLSQNFPGPADNGTYKIQANFLNSTFTVTKQ